MPSANPRTRRLGGVAALALTALLVAGLPPAQADPGDQADRTEREPRTGSRTKHSSDGVVGRIAPPISAEARRAATTTVLANWLLAPGVGVTSFDRADARGNIRGYLATISLSQPGVTMDYLGARDVRTREPVSSMVARDGAVLGVNGDFFDISDTQAPLGIGVSRTLGAVHGPESGWNTGFWIDRAGFPQIGELPMTAKIKQFPKVKVTNLNSPTVAPDRVGVYTVDWGTTVGSRVTDGQTSKVREVVVKGGRVVRNRARLSTGKPIDSMVLIGRGRGASKLRALRVGRKVKVKYAAAGNPLMAITGNRQLLDEGVRTVVDDKEMHPRTAIGIDRDTNTVLLLAIDGRQSFSRGYTMVELANLMREYGAEDALNLDGGGSTAMAGLLPDGSLGVFNSPSDGAERPVPDGLSVTYTPPVG